ncbi:unnamed protein product [Alternaria alternata]|uniref:Uncharacterized protein n=2 Tax=Alternaria alternata complex TaxID=187734 RepID=A0A4Q4NYM4_ALTAL|nr:hypothetical protein AALT_g7351 [Alternaria alternata]RYN38664.1 hypothetical protein AA0115_g565 [Alternaria tenuissima]RYN84414.1 hypothetical protein AA0117_g222 [Alternaria alternata]RYN99830.1 hypothetical protein AA0119_g6633 [Alternaria tenuissima]RYO25387.1 hypothetical protein AA0121_g224 [Alternaria tenuissima]
MFVAPFAELKARINGLIVKTTSMSSSLSETSTSARDNARDKPSTQPRYAIKKPSMRLFPKTQAPLPTVNIMTKHSHTFNSSTATGLDKLGQLQFVEVLKNWIVEVAPFIATTNSDKSSSYKVVFTAKRLSTENTSAIASVAATSLYIAKLFAIRPNLWDSDWTLVEQSSRTDTLIDAVEDLWERVMHRADSLAYGTKVGAMVDKRMSGDDKIMARKSAEW